MQPFIRATADSRRKKKTTRQLAAAAAAARNLCTFPPSGPSTHECIDSTAAASVYWASLQKILPARAARTRDCFAERARASVILDEAKKKQQKKSRAKGEKEGEEIWGSMDPGHVDARAVEEAALEPRFIFSDPEESIGGTLALCVHRRAAVDSFFFSLWTEFFECELCGVLLFFFFPSAITEPLGVFVCPDEMIKMCVPMRAFLSPKSFSRLP